LLLGPAAIEADVDNFLAELGECVSSGEKLDVPSWSERRPKFELLADCSKVLEEWCGTP
jgi:hypothetical protein